MPCGTYRCEITIQQRVAVPQKQWRHLKKIRNLNSAFEKAHCQFMAKINWITEAIGMLLTLTEKKILYVI
jgi:hypothetical protein